MRRLIVWILVGIVGCGSSGPPKATVNGAVSLDGVPVPRGAITFTAVDGSTPTSGTEIKDGRYTAEVYLGDMQVSLSYPKVTGKKKAYDTPDSPYIESTTEVMPERVRQDSELRAAVKSGSNTHDFHIKSN